jgi:proteic killer suppression protein
VIKSFRHAGIELFYRSGSKRGINPAHAKRLLLQLTALDEATQPGDMNIPGWYFHPLTKKLTGHWSVRVNGNWRITFTFDGEDAVLIDYQDYH